METLQFPSKVHTARLRPSDVLDQGLQERFFAPASHDFGLHVCFAKSRVSQ